jgi:hypothetical protein
MSAVSSPSASWQTGFLAVMPVIENHARIRFRYLRPERRQDAIQEAIASACCSYQKLAARGKLHVATAGSLATYAVSHVRGGRHVGGPKETLNDLLSPVAHHRHGIQNLTHPARSSNAHSDGWVAEAIADKKASVIDLVWTRLDFAA